MAATMIGGAFLSASVQTLVEKLASKEFLDYFKNATLNVSLLRQLQTILLTLQVVLDDAEVKQINNPAVKQWLDDLKDAVFDAEDLLNEISYDSLRCKVENTQADHNKTNKVWNFLSSPFKNFYREINSQMKIICDRLQLFAQHKDILGLQTKGARLSHRAPSSSVLNDSVIVGRKDDKDMLIDVLVSDYGTSKNYNLRVVAITGMGGVGKTTLAQHVYNDETVGQHFDLKVWVCVSEDFDVMRVTRSILESIVRNTTYAASKVWESDYLDILRVELKKNLKNKRFLFVLDDMWNDNYNDWDDLISPFLDGKLGSSVIITSRHQNVAEMAHAFPIHKLQPLSDEDCWFLLSKHAFGNDDFHCIKNTNLGEIGQKIARKCDGLPLAAKTLGGLLRSKVDVKEWTLILKSEVWNLPNDDIIPALHLSYQYLPSNLKRCFAYCSIFPKDYPIDKEKLIWLWMAEGFLDFSQSGRMVEDVGDDFFVELLSRSLIQQSSDDAGGKMFFMHDLVNDLARVVSGKSCCWHECNNISQNVRHLSYNQEEYDLFMEFENFYEFKSLRTFLPYDFWRTTSYLSVKVVNDLLPTLKRLRVLSLSTYKNITKLPDSIGNLVQLRYLDLSFTGIKSLPDTTCNLYNLQTLILSYCLYLIELPVRMGNLINLRHLDISGTNIKELPVEIGGLENLQTLTLFLVGKQHEGLSIKELGKFPNLHGKLTIKNLHNVVDVTEAKDANLESKEQIEELELLWGNQSEDSRKVKVVLDKLQPSANLKKLSINLYGGTSFPSWLGNSSFSNMVSLCINNCEYCTTLPPLGQLSFLKNLSLEGMLILETIGSEFYYLKGGEDFNSCFQPFPSLECLKFQNMPVLKEWLPFEGNNLAFPRLKILNLLDCPELKGNLPSHLSSLEVFKIEGCDHLMETQPTLHWLLSIKKIEIEGDLYWEGITERTQPSMLESSSSCLLQGVRIISCYTLLYVPKMIICSTCLQHLELYEIPSLTAFPMDGLPTSLQSLNVGYCSNLSFLPLETWRNYTSLVTLRLKSSCDCLTSFPLDCFPALQSLEIDECKNLKTINFISESHSRHQLCLRSLKIINRCIEVKVGKDMLLALEELALDCDELSFCEGFCLPPNLQSIDIRSKRTTLSVTEWGFQGLTALSNLIIARDITNNLLKEPLLPISLVSLQINYSNEIKSIGGNGLRHLSSLETLCFFYSPKLESLSELTMPSSLKSLQFVRCDSLVSLPKLTMPSSLKSLKFSECRSLVSLSELMLPSSLETLQFQICDRLVSLPDDNIPSSLKTLTIYQCPLLEERYKRKEHWSKIAHIPFIKIDLQLTI